jgi:hypothetical protein
MIIQQLTKPELRNLRVAEAFNHTILTVISAFNEYWNRPDDELLAEMNANATETIALFSAHEKINLAMNEVQDALNVRNGDSTPTYPARAPIERGRNDIGFENGAFFIIPPPEPEPTPEPEIIEGDPQPELEP